MAKEATKVKGTSAPVEAPPLTTLDTTPATKAPSHIEALVEI